MHAYAQQTYKTNNVQSMTPGEQVARLLETAAKHIYRAKAHAEANEYAERLQATEDAMKIITALQGCLMHTDQTAGIADTLSSYYSALTLQITHINMKNDPQMCDKVIDSLRTMARTWREAESLTRQAAPVAATPAMGTVDLGAC